MSSRIERHAVSRRLNVLLRDRWHPQLPFSRARACFARIESGIPLVGSTDMRAGVIARVESGASRREAAEHYEVSASTAVIWVPLSAPGLEPSFWLSAGYFRSTPMSRHSQCLTACLERAMSGSDRGYSISLSARNNNTEGTITPIALAVLRLIASSNFVGCSTGRSAGIVPRKRLAANRAVRSAK
jgi:hypothetical protein